jgi:hypothetical protein
MALSATLARAKADADGRRSTLRLEPVSKRRRPALAAGSIALVIASVAVFVSVYAKAGSQVSVLAVERAVPQGQVLTAADLDIVRISTASGIATVSAAEAGAVIGRRAGELLEAGTLLAPDELVSTYSPPAGQAIVGVAAKEGQLPASGVQPGEAVDIILTGLPGEEDAASLGSEATGAPSSDTTPTDAGTGPGVVGALLVPDALVLEADPSPASSGADAVDVSLLVPSSQAPLVASAAVAGQVALVVVDR